MAGLVILLGVAALLVAACYVLAVAMEVLRPPRASAAWALARGRPCEPGDLGLVACEWTHEVPGASLPVWEVDLSREGERDRPSVVLVHGWGRSRIDMLSRLPPFLDDAARIYLVDLRGHGDASGRTQLGAAEGRDMATLVDRLPSGPIVFVGHSMGANACLEAAALRPDRVSGVIAIAPYDTLLVPLRARLASRELPSGLAASLILFVLRFACGDTGSTLANARSVRCPVLVLQGDGDRISPLAGAKAIADACRAEFVVFEGVEHAEHESRQPDRFLDACSRFLRTIAGSTPAPSERRAAVEPPAGNG